MKDLALIESYIFKKDKPHMALISILYAVIALPNLGTALIDRWATGSLEYQHSDWRRSS